jgi:hypothetical protein
MTGNTGNTGNTANTGMSKTGSWSTFYIVPASIGRMSDTSCNANKGARQ